MPFFLLAQDVLAQRVVNNSCNREESKESCKKALVPFRYANLVVTDITYRKFNQVKEIVVPLFYDSKYRYVFSLDGLPADIQVQIYDRHSTDKKRKLIYEFSSSEKMVTYEPDESKGYSNLFINYLIPADQSENPNELNKGCVVLMGGFENVGGFNNESDEVTNN